MNSKNNKSALLTVGQRIADVRKNVLHISQEKLAEYIGVKLRTIQRYESNDTVPPDSFYNKVQQKNELVNIDWIKTGIGDRLRFSDPVSKDAFDYSIVYNPISFEDCKLKLQLAIQEIRMLRAAIAYKDTLLEIFRNQSVTS